MAVMASLSSVFKNSFDLVRFISSQSFDTDRRRDTTYDVATIPFNLPLTSAVLRESCPFFDVIFPSLLLFSPPSCSFHCPLQKCLRYSRVGYIWKILPSGSKQWLIEILLLLFFCCFFYYFTLKSLHMHLGKTWLFYFDIVVANIKIKKSH